MAAVTGNLNEIHFIIAISWILLGFGMYYFLSRNESLSLKIWKAKAIEFPVRHVLIQRAWGFIWLGIASLLLVIFFFHRSPAQYGLNFRFQQSLPWWTYILVLLIIPNSYLAAKNGSFLHQYPQFRVNLWTIRTVLINSVSWILYLIGYEFFFRGFFLYASLEVLNPWPALFLNSTCYAFAHFYKGPEETFGAFPLGILFAYLTLLTGNIWTAVGIHTIMALANEYFSLWKQPDMHYLKKNIS